MPHPCLHLALLASAVLGLAAAAPAQVESTVLRNARVHVRPGTVLDGADVLIVKDVIKAVGLDLKVPDGASIVDLAGEDLYPGMIDPLNDGLLEPGHSGRGSFGAGDPTIDAFDAFIGAHNRELLSGGVLTVGLGPHPKGVSGGVLSVVAVGPGGGEPSIVAKNQFVASEISAIETTFRQEGRPGGGGGGRRGGFDFGLPLGTPVPTTSILLREGAVKAIDELVEGGKKYREAWEKYQKDFTEYEKKLAEWEKTKGADSKPASRPAPEPERRAEGGGGGRVPMPPDFRNWPREKQREWMRENGMGGGGRRNQPSESAESESAPAGSGKPKPPEKPRVEPGKEALVRVLKREVPLWIVAHWASDIDAALELAKTRNIRVVIAGASEAARRLDALRDARVVVALGAPLSIEADNLDRIMQREDLCSTLVKAGIPVTFFTAGDTSMGPASLPLAAALGVGCGMTEDQALAAVTVHAARSLGLEKKLGTIEPERIASLFTCKGSPLAPEARMLRIWVRGKPVEMEKN